MSLEILYDSVYSDEDSKSDETDQSPDTDQSRRSTIRRRPSTHSRIFDTLDGDGELRENRAQAMTARDQIPYRPRDEHAQVPSTKMAAERRKVRSRSPPLKSSLGPGTKAPRQTKQDEWMNGQNEWKTAQNVWTASTKHDVTLHFEMDVAHDVESKLEEFSELKRLGHFHAAEQFYQDSLKPFSDLYPIAIEYADMLVEQGAYERLEQFIAAKKGLFMSAEKSTEGSRAEGEEVNEKHNLQLIAAYSAIHTHGKLSEAYDQVLAVENAIRSMPGENPSAVAWEPSGVALYALKILSLVEEETDLVPEYRFDIWSNCCSMYKMLVVQDRIWDARDMITALVESDRPVNTWRWIFNADIYSRDAFAQLFVDWNVQVYDSSTYLAILDILVSVARGLGSLLPNEEDLQAAELCLQHACTVATCLKENYPRTVKSRSYMHWVLAEEDFQRKKMPREDSLKDKGFPGLKILRGALPMYVPIKNENPTWRVVYGRAKEHPVALLESTLQAARELGDYATEVWCMEEMISCSPEPPVERFAQLSHVQKTLMGDMFGYQRTCMSKFLLAETDQSRGELLDELETIRAQRQTSFSYSLSDWCEVMIKKVLCESLGIRKSYTRAELNGFSYFLPQFIKDILVEMGLDEMYDLDFESKPNEQT